MIVGLYQCRSPAGDVRLALDILEEALRHAAVADVDMLVMPELFLPGYRAGVNATLKADLQHEISGLDHRGVGLVLGMPEQRASQTHNSAFCYDGSGTLIATHQKLQPFGAAEAARFVAGTGHTIFDYMGIRFGVLICYDVEFPEHVRELARAGAQVILVPTANMMPFINVNQIIVPARAAENGVTIVYANYCGSEGDLDYTGHSIIAGPDGYALAAKGTGTGLCVAELPNGWSEHGIPLSTQIDDLNTVRVKRTTL